MGIVVHEVKGGYCGAPTDSILVPAAKQGGRAYRAQEYGHLEDLLKQLPFW